MCILLNVKKHEKTFALNVDIFKKKKRSPKMLVMFGLLCYNGWALYRTEEDRRS